MYGVFQEKENKEILVHFVYHKSTIFRSTAGGETAAAGRSDRAMAEARAVPEAGGAAQVGARRKTLLPTGRRAFGAATDRGTKPLRQQTAVRANDRVPGPGHGFAATAALGAGFLRRGCGRQCRSGQNQLPAGRERPRCQAHSPSRPAGGSRGRETRSSGLRAGLNRETR